LYLARSIKNISHDHEVDALRFSISHHFDLVETQDSRDEGMRVRKQMRVVALHHGEEMYELIVRDGLKHEELIR